MDSSDFIIFFDGVCNLCNGLVDFLLQADQKRGSFKVASLQGSTAAQKLPPELRTSLSSIVVLDHGRTYTKSHAVWVIFGLLPWPWRLVTILRVLPPALSDVIYDFVATHRYKIFGQAPTCRIPTPAERAYFLD